MKQHCLYTRTGVHGIPKQLKSRFLASQDTTCNRAAVHAHPHFQCGRVFSQRIDQLCRQLRHFGHAVASKLGHDDGMILLWLGKTRDGYVAITNSFNLEHFSPQRNSVKSPVDVLEQFKDLFWLSCCAPGCESGRKTHRSRKRQIEADNTNLKQMHRNTYQ